MIIFVYGTTAEAIKIAPVARRLMARGIPFQQWVTMQHTDALRAILPQLGLPEPDELIADGNRGKALTSVRDVFGWLRTVHRWMRRELPRLRADLPHPSIVLVHGDTLTTVVGAWIARRLRIDLAHIEAGLRSGNWRHPFPEELDRRIVGRLATIHYPPSEEAAANLKNAANVVPTPGNTVIDAVLDRIDDVADDVREPFGVVLLHRFEFISNADLVRETVTELARSTPVPLRIMVDAYSEGALADAVREHGEGRFELQPKLEHPQFVALLRAAEFVVTDSGGIQEETALLGVPTLVHRKATERHEGVGENITLSEWRVEKLRTFLASYSRYRVPMRPPETSPSDIIVDDLVRRGYGAGA